MKQHLLVTENSADMSFRPRSEYATHTSNTNDAVSFRSEVLEALYAAENSAKLEKLAEPAQVAKQAAKPIELPKIRSVDEAIARAREKRQLRAMSGAKSESDVIDGHGVAVSDALKGEDLQRLDMFDHTRAKASEIYKNMTNTMKGNSDEIKQIEKKIEGIDRQIDFIITKNNQMERVIERNSGNILEYRTNCEAQIRELQTQMENVMLRLNINETPNSISKPAPVSYPVSKRMQKVIRRM